MEVSGQGGGTRGRGVLWTAGDQAGNGVGRLVSVDQNETAAG